VTGELPAVLAIDGGNSKTDIALVGADGRLLGSARGPGAPPPDVGMDNALAIIGGLITGAAQDAGLLGRGEWAGDRGPVARHLSACMAGADLPQEEQEIAVAFAAQGWSQTTAVLNDTFALLRAGATRPWGVAVVCGAGINCVGVGPDGRIARFLALGQFTGDWGGGMWLGKEIMWWAMRAEDGRGPQTALCAAAAAHFGERSVHDVAVAIHLGRITENDLVTLTPTLFATADEGDTVAVGLVGRQAEEVFLMARSALTRLDLLDSDAEVVLGGGVLAARHPLLVDGVEARLKRFAPSVVPTYGEIPPVAGAALLGLDRLPGGAEAGRALRAAYAPR
jgi:N-acetylglucosamine kinase-like BadF-type ATPase